MLLNADNYVKYPPVVQGDINKFDILRYFSYNLDFAPVLNW